MDLPNNQPRETSLCKVLEKERICTAPPDVSQTYDNRQSEVFVGSIKQEETLDKKRKYGEITQYRGHYGQLAANSTPATEMNYSRINEAFSGFNHPPNNTYACDDHFRDTGNSDVFHPRMHGLDRSIILNDPDYNCALNDNGMATSSGVLWPLSGGIIVPPSFVPGTPVGCRSSHRGSTDEDRAYIKHKSAHGAHTTSGILAEDSDFSASEFEGECPRKAFKINKDGAPRKPRQPRPKLLKWSDDDWKNVCLGIVWACGETGVQIPFDQAAQVVGEQCTAGALQQALLKLRCKQIAEGYQIPNLKMAWTRKNRYATPSSKNKSSQEPEANRPRKQPTRMEATQSYLITLPRAYNDQDRQGLTFPYKWKKPPRKARTSTIRSSTNVDQECSAETSTSSFGFINDHSQHQNTLGLFTYTYPETTQDTQSSIGMGQSQSHIPGSSTRDSRTLTPNRDEGTQCNTTIYDYAHWFEHPGTITAVQESEHLPATPINCQQPYNSPPSTPFGNNTGYLHGLVFSGGELISLIPETLHEYGNSIASATDDVFTT